MSVVIEYILIVRILKQVNISIESNLNVAGSLAVIVEADGNLHVKLQFQFLYRGRNSASSLVGEIKHCGTKKIESGAFVRAVKSLGNRPVDLQGVRMLGACSILYTLLSNINLILNETLFARKVFS